MRILGLCCVQVAVAHHQPEDDRLSRTRGIGVLDRIVQRGRLGQPGQQRALRQVELRRVNPEVGLARGLDACREVAVVGRVEIEGEQFILGVAPLQPPGQPRLAQLARESAFLPLLRGEQQVPRELLRQRAAAGDGFARAPVEPRGTRDRDRVYTGMVIEVCIFCGNRGVAAGSRNVIQGQWHMLVAARVDGLVEHAALPVGDDDARRGRLIDQVCGVQPARQKVAEQRPAQDKRQGDERTWQQERAQAAIGHDQSILRRSGYSIQYTPRRGDWFHKRCRPAPRKLTQRRKDAQV